MGRVCRIAHRATLLGPSGPPARRWVTRTRPSGPEKARATALPIPIFVICLAAMAIPAKCGTDDLAALLGVTVRRVTQLVEKKVLLGEARGSFDTCDSVHRFVAHRETVVAKEHGLGAYGRARAQQAMPVIGFSSQPIHGSILHRKIQSTSFTSRLSSVAR